MFCQEKYEKSFLSAKYALLAHRSMGRHLKGASILKWCRLLLIGLSPDEIWEPLHQVSYVFPERNFPFKYINREIDMDNISRLHLL